MRSDPRVHVTIPIVLAATMALLPGALEARLRATAPTGDPAAFQGQSAPAASAPAARRPAAAQPTYAAPAPVPQGPPPDVDARQTQEALNRVLDQQPPTLRRVLQFDPSLLTNQDYLASYPGLAAFLAQHPEVARNPSFFIGQPDGDSRPPSDTVRIWSDFTNNAAIMVVFLVVSSALIWLFKTVIEYRRWLRLSRLHAEMQAKLVDRFSSSEELLAYIQSPAGQRMVDAAPSLPEVPAARMAAPFGRILWSLQAGLVLGAAGIGFLFVSNRVPVEVGPLLSVVGVLGVALGIGFFISSAAAWVLSQRLGLLKPAGRSGDDADAPRIPA